MEFHLSEITLFFLFSWVTYSIICTFPRLIENYLFQGPLDSFSPLMKVQKFTLSYSRLRITCLLQPHYFILLLPQESKKFIIREMCRKLGIRVIANYLRDYGHPNGFLNESIKSMSFSISSST